eukprot:m.193352 g.193352  ORF g.193352 m.193352 type:complete len:264 (+) comp18632_c0_seq2:184-975(+)
MAFKMPTGGGGSSSGSSGGDRTTFVGVIVPRAIKNLPKYIAALPESNEVFKSILNVVVASFEGEELGDDCAVTDLCLSSSFHLYLAISGIFSCSAHQLKYLRSHAMIGLSSLVTKEVSEELLHHVFAGLHALLTAALRHPPKSFKKQHFADDLHALGLETKQATEISKVVYGAKRASIEDTHDKNAIKLPQLADFKWRVDVAISTSELQRVMKPAVLMQMTLSDGTIQTFEMPVEQFHKLRYNTAFVLKEMEDLEKRGILQQP